MDRNGDKTLAIWLKDHSYALLTFAVTLAFNAGVIMMTIMGLKSTMNEAVATVSALEVRVDNVERGALRDNAEIAKALYGLQKDVAAIREHNDRTLEKFKEIDQGIREFYRSYDLKRKGN